MRDRGNMSMIAVEAVPMRMPDGGVMRMVSVALATKSPNGADYYVLDSTRWNSNLHYSLAGLHVCAAEYTRSC